MTGKQPTRWRRWVRLLVNTAISVCVVQLSTVLLFAFYQLVRRVMQAAGSRLPEFPLWLAVWALGAALVAVAINLYFFRRGEYDRENPMWTGGRAMRESSRRSKKSEETV